MAAHYARGTHGKGQHVDVSIQQVAFSRNFNGVLCWQFDRRKLRALVERWPMAKPPSGRSGGWRTAGASIR
jgi:crotonobetainyl-CoA:carnitine CoA-transferase CaiB-like acyl-CoA transferase